jgi:hypothetical protein
MRMRIAHGVRLKGVANKTPYLRPLWALPNELKHNGAGFSTTSIDLLCLRVAQMPRSRHLAIFVLTTDRQTDRHPNRLLYPLLRMRARGVMMSSGRICWGGAVPFNCCAQGVRNLRKPHPCRSFLRETTNTTRVGIATIFLLKHAKVSHCSVFISFIPRERGSILDYYQYFLVLGAALPRNPP